MTLADIRKAANMSQSQIAVTMGVSQGIVSQWEAGISFPHASKIVALAKVYGITADEILEAIAGMKEQKQNSA